MWRSVRDNRRMTGSSPLRWSKRRISRTPLGVPALRNIHIRTIKFGDGRATEQPQSAVEVGAQDFDGAIDAGFSGSGEAVGVGASAEHGFRAEAEGLDDVGAPANASVHQDFGLSVDGLDHLRQGPQRRGNAIELAAAMIGNGNCRRALIDGATRIVPSEDAFDYDRAAPRFANPA